MAEQAKWMTWLPKTDEFIALLETTPREVCRSANFHFRPRTPAQVSVSIEQRIGSVSFSKDELIIVEEKYEEFRNLLLKLTHAKITLQWFALVSTPTNTFIVLSLLDPAGRPNELRYIRDGNGDWFPDDLLADLKRLTKDVIHSEIPPESVTQYDVFAPFEEPPKQLEQASKPSTTMTYAELAEWMADFTEEQRQSAVTVFVSGTSEYYSLVKDYPALTSDEDDVLDKGHPYLKI